MDVGSTSAAPPASRSPEKKVIDFTYLEAKFAVKEIAEREPREGDKLFSDLPPLAVKEDGTVMQLVRHESILALLKSPPRDKLVCDYSIEALRRTFGTADEEELEAMVMTGRALQVMRDIKSDVLEQYLDKGYAYIVLPEYSDRYPLSAGKDLPPLP